jgi:hypothetical protein
MEAENLATLFHAKAGVNRRAPAFWPILVLWACAPEGEAGALNVVNSTPESGAVHANEAPIRIGFDEFLDPRMPLEQAVTLTSAELVGRVRVTYDPVDRALLVLPDRPLRVGVGYKVTVHADVVRGFAGETLAADFVLGFLAGSSDAPRTPLPRVDYDAELAPVFEAKCDCHGPEPAVFPPLDPASMIGVTSQRQPDRLLVRPGRALDSYLVQRILQDYPGVRGLPMPLEAPLTRAEQRLVVSWVERLEEGL